MSIKFLYKQNAINFKSVRMDLRLQRRSQCSLLLAACSYHQIINTSVWALLRFFCNNVPREIRFQELSSWFFSTNFPAWVCYFLLDSCRAFIWSYWRCECWSVLNWHAGSCRCLIHLQTESQVSTKIPLAIACPTFKMQLKMPSSLKSKKGRWFHFPRLNHLCFSRKTSQALQPWLAFSSLATYHWWIFPSPNAWGAICGFIWMWNNSFCSWRQRSLWIVHPSAFLENAEKYGWHHHFMVVFAMLI